MRIADERLWWHFSSVFYDVRLLPYARRGYTRNDVHCRSHARNVYAHYLTEQTDSFKVSFGLRIAYCRHGNLRKFSNSTSCFKPVKLLTHVTLGILHFHIIFQVHLLCHSLRLELCSVHHTILHVNYHVRRPKVSLVLLCSECFVLHDSLASRFRS